MEDLRIVTLAEMDEDGLEQLSVLHCSVMHTLLSDLGLPIVRKYYQVAQGQKNVLGVCALDASRKVVGWAMGSPDPAALNARLRQPLLWFLLQMLRVALTKPHVFAQLLASVSFSAAAMEAEAMELTYIGVDSSQKGRGVGRILLQKFVEESRAKGYHSVVLSVEDENKSALALYQKQGFKITRSFTEGQYQRHRMELALA